MQIETLMVHADTSPETRSRLALAASMARSLDAALIGVAAGRTEAVGPANRSGALLAEAAEIEQLLYVAGERFAQAVADLDRASWRAGLLDPVIHLSLNARAADMIIVGPRPEHSGLTPLSVDPQDVLVEAGRPVLFVPAEVKAWAGERVLVAWKDGKEARRAVHDALPLLRRAQAVTVIALSEGGAPDGLKDVTAWLGTHGVKAERQAGRTRFGAAGDDILAFAAGFKADLIVAGAFSRSRGQERVFGGVTIDLLGRSETAVLFAH